MGCKTISFDSSVNSTGYAIFINGEYSSCGKITVSANDTSKDKIIKMIHEIYKVVERENPDICVWETPVVLRNAETQRNLTMVVGAILGKCVDNDIFCYSFRPTEWRKIVGEDEKLPRKREELKKWGINKVSQLFDIELDSDDMADAILIGQAYVNQFIEE